jgi:hypothetical protein
MADYLAEIRTGVVAEWTNVLFQSAKVGCEDMIRFLRDGNSFFYLIYVNSFDSEIIGFL